jgi:hypothetical protein
MYVSISSSLDKQSIHIWGFNFSRNEALLERERSIENEDFAIFATDHPECRDNIETWLIKLGWPEYRAEHHVSILMAAFPNLKNYNRKHRHDFQGKLPGTS